MITAPHRAYRLVDPPPDALVFPAQRVRPDTPASVLPRLSDNVWQLSFLDHLDTASSRTFSWWDVPEPLRTPLKRTAYAVLHLPAPAILMERGYTATRPVLSASSFHKTLRAWRDFARWLAGHNIVRLQDADAQVLEAYARKVATAAGGVRQRRRQLFELTRAWAYAPFLPAGDRLVIPPWEDDGAAIRDFFDTQDLVEGECDTPVIHPATMSPLLVWSLRMVTDLAPDITTGLREWRRLAANTAATSTPEGSERLRTFCHALRATDGAFPTYAGVQRATYDRHTNRRPPLARAYLAGLLAITPATIDNLLMREPALLDGIRFSPGAPLDIRLTGRIDGKPWRESIDHADAVQFAVHLATAAMITIAYLSGMRPAEVLHLRRGCAVREERADGTVRHTLTGRHFKNVLDADGATKPADEIRPEPWTVIELVHRAVTVLGDLSTEDLLFPRSLSANPHARQQAHGGAAISTHTANNRITYFAAFANCLAESLGRDHEMIPDDPAGPISMRRFRRTAAWFIYRQPGGPVALGLQYGHLRQTLAAAYGDRTKQDMLTVLDFERQLALADTLAEASDRLAAGEGVSGPAADRYVTATRAFETRYAGGFATRTQLRALGNDLQLQLYETPDSMLTCNYDPYKALCDPGRGRDTRQRTPSVDRCDPACANISRTDPHRPRPTRSGPTAE